LLSSAVAAVLRQVGDGFRLMAIHSGDHPVGMPPNPEYVPIDPVANFPSRVFLNRTMLHIPDWSAIELPAHERRVYESMGVRSSLMLPLLREGNCVGVLLVGRTSVRAYDDQEIGLMESFADQAVIAIENVRLFRELEARNRDLTATGEILRVISTSPTDAQPVFDVIVASAVRLCNGNFGALHRYDGMALHLVAHSNIRGEALEYLRQLSPRPPGRAVRE